MSRPELPKYLTAAEAAEVLRIKPIDAGRLCQSGAIKAVKPGRKWLITPDDLRAYIERGNTEDAA